MKDETEQLIDLLNEAGRVYEHTDPIQKERELWHWQRSNEDCDVSLGIGQYAMLGDMIQVVREHPLWTIRFLSTGDPNEIHVNMALIFHPPRPDPTGSAFLENL